jgi:hypothetical protein
MSAKESRAGAGTPDAAEDKNQQLAPYAPSEPNLKAPPNLEGLTPESWLCIDCGVNTAPGLSSRAELEAAFAADENDNGIEQHITADSEVYTVRERVWAAAGMEPQGGCLCIGCLEKRLGRPLKPKDFQRDHAFNHPAIRGTARLLKRRGQRRGTFTLGGGA